MKIKKILASFTLVISLSGCSSVLNFPEAEPTKFSSVSSESPSVAEKPNSVVTPRPQQTQIDEVSWDLYPGVKTKVSQLVAEKNCENLVLLVDEYLTKDKALDNYLNNELALAGCD